MAAEAKPFVAVIDPDHKPFGAPGDMPIKIEQFCRDTKQAPPASVGEVVRICLESLGLTYRKTIEGLEDVLGRKLGVIHIVGGGTQNELLNQMTADACGRTVVAGPVEATAIGNILAQATAVGGIRSLAEARAIIRNSFDVKTYEPRDTKKWNAVYGRYRQVASA
jgi:rhamnulokinase